MAPAAERETEVVRAVVGHTAAAGYTHWVGQAAAVATAEEVELVGALATATVAVMVRQRAAAAAVEELEASLVEPAGL